MPPTENAVTPGKTAICCVLAWLVPGAGHFMLGKRGRAAIFFCCITAMFFLGIQMKGELVAFSTQDLFALLKFAAEAGAGLLYFGGRAAGMGLGEIKAYTYDYGNVFLYGAGLLNMLIVFDAFDIALGRKK